MHWITAHAGTPDTIVTPARSRGLHGGRLNDGTARPAPLRFVLPAGALT
jgi:hypothetical protein